MDAGAAVDVRRVLAGEKTDTHGETLASRRPQHSPAASRAGYLGVDLGTSGLKLALVAADGSSWGESEASYPVHSPAPGRAESDPADWVQALEAALADLTAGLLRQPGRSPVVTAVGVSGQMHGIVLVGADGGAIRPAILWPDQRAESVLPTWRELPSSVRERLSNPLAAGMGGPILHWLHEHEPSTLAAAARIASPKDWLRSQLSGDRVTERSDASATLLWDVTADDWSAEALALAGVTHEQLPRIVGSDDFVGTARLEAFGPGHDAVPVVAGGADTACALAALEHVRHRSHWADTLVLNVGTGVQVLRPAAVARPRIDPLSHVYADTEGGWYDMLAVQNGGLALAWVQDVLRLTWDELVSNARESPPASTGALFHPFLTGERGGVARPGSTAAWSGLTLSVGRGELARSAFEGLAFTVRRAIEVSGGHTGPVLLSGGGAREPWVRQLLADVVGLPMSYVDLRSPTAVGAAVLAARGVGDRLPVLADVVEVTPRPSTELEAAYVSWLAPFRGWARGAESQ